MWLETVEVERNVINFADLLKAKFIQRGGNILAFRRRRRRWITLFMCIFHFAEGSLLSIYVFRGKYLFLCYKLMFLVCLLKRVQSPRGIIHELRWCSTSLFHFQHAFSFHLRAWHHWRMSVIICLAFLIIPPENLWNKKIKKKSILASCEKRSNFFIAPTQL